MCSLSGLWSGLFDSAYFENRSTILSTPNFVRFICATLIGIQLAIFKDKSPDKNYSFNIFQHNFNNNQTKQFSNILFMWMALGQNY